MLLETRRNCDLPPENTPGGTHFIITFLFGTPNVLKFTLALLKSKIEHIWVHIQDARCLWQVVYWEDDTKPETMGKVRVPWNQTSVTVSGLAGNTQYFLTVSAFNTAGTGPFLPAINVTTKKPRKLQRLLHAVCAWLQNQYLPKISFSDMVL